MITIIFDFIKLRFTTLLSAGAIGSINYVDSLNSLNNGFKLIASISISIGAIIHIILQIKNELKKRKGMNND